MTFLAPCGCAPKHARAGGAFVGMMGAWSASAVALPAPAALARTGGDAD